MMILVIGGSGSGKSSYAEDLTCSLAAREHIKKYYLATMQVFDAEGKQKVERHRKFRDGKGFLTIEQPIQIENALFKMEKGKRAVLLECISNLTANEMFAGSQPRPKEEVVESIIKGLGRVKEKAAQLVIVSNNVFEDGIVYDETTMDYICAMGKINQTLAAWADEVVEIVAGIPVPIRR